MENVNITLHMDSSSTRFAPCFGISPEREKQLDDLMDAAHTETETYPEAIKQFADNGVTANELAYACFHIGAFAENARMKVEVSKKVGGLLERMDAKIKELQEQDGEKTGE